MISLTRLNNRPFILNSDLIKFIEQSPDTVITLLNGEKLLVLENADEVRSRILDFRRGLLHGICPALLSSPPQPSLSSAANPPPAEPGEPAGG